MKYKQVFITIAATNFEEIINFYSRLFQISPAQYRAGIYAEFELQELKLGIFSPKESHREEFAHSQGSSLSFCVEVENLEEAIAHLKECDYPVATEITYASHGQEIYVYDPVGNRLILHQSI